MTFTDEDAGKIKEHLLKQLDNFPEDKRGQIEQQIKSMTTEQVKEFVEQNNLGHLNGECLFCEIIKKKRMAYIIGENESNLAILEINPLSKGHSLIVPLNHDSEISDSSKELAKTIVNKLKNKFEPKTVTTKEIKIMGHPLIEITPIYGGETERKTATEEELEKLRDEIIEEEPEPEIQEKEEESIPKLPPRIP
jgi:hypothetical protein